MIVKSSSSSTTETQVDTASDMTEKSTKKADTTSGKYNLLKNLAKKYIYGQIFILTYEKNS